MNFFRKKQDSNEQLTEQNEINQEEQLEHDSQQSDLDELDQTQSGNHGLIADAFDAVNPIVASTEPEEEDEPGGIRIQYGFYPEEAKKALKIFQKYTIYKKNLIYSLIIGVLLISYVLETIKTPSQKFNLFMSVICFSVLGFIWYFPLRHISSTVKAIGMQEYTEDYIIKLFDTYIKIGEDESTVKYDIVKDRLRAWETEDLFIIGLAKERVFVIPKRCCSGQEEEISQKLQNSFQDQYRNLEKQ